MTRTEFEMRLRNAKHRLAYWEAQNLPEAKPDKLTKDQLARAKANLAALLIQEAELAVI